MGAYIGGTSVIAGGRAGWHTCPLMLVRTGAFFVLHQILRILWGCQLYKSHNFTHIFQQWIELSQKLMYSFCQQSCLLQAIWVIEEWSGGASPLYMKTVTYIINPFSKISSNFQNVYKTYKILLEMILVRLLSSDSESSSAVVLNVN